MNETNLLCPLCNETYDIPLDLCCGNTICNKCLKQFYIFNDQMISCKFCDELCHDVPKTGFQINKNIERILLLKNLNMNEKDYYLERLNAEMHKLKESTHKIDLLYNKPELLIDDYFGTIRNAVDIHTEKMINDINQARKKFLDELDRKEEECKINLASLRMQKGDRIEPEDDQLKLESDKKMDAWTQEIAKIESKNAVEFNEEDEHRFEKLNNEISSYSSGIESKFENKRAKYLLNSIIEFKPIAYNKENLLGSLDHYKNVTLNFIYVRFYFFFC